MPLSRHFQLAPSLVVLGVGLAAIHVADDNFVQPESGGVSSHLASGLVPLAVFAAIGWAALRDRGDAPRGGRGVVTVVLGLLAAMVGAESIHHLGSGLRGDDWSGLPAAACGAALLGLGVREIWRSRLRTGSRARRYSRRALKSLGAALIVLQVAYPVVESYAITNTASRATPRSTLGVATEDVTLRTSDGLRLRGWYVPSRNGAAVLVFPGRTGAQRQARVLISHGYGVLLLDRRGTGESDGEPNGYGWGSDRDIDAAVEFLQGRADVDPQRIGGLGLSVGGELLLEAASDDSGLRAVVSEGAGIRSVHEFVEIDAADRWLFLPLSLSATVATAVFANDMPPASLTDLVPRIHVPVFFIYSADGQGGEELSKTFYTAANEPKQIWAPRGGHVGGLTSEPAEYERRVIAFFDESLPATPASGSGEQSYRPAGRRVVETCLSQS